jgi:hypothetical protein
MATKRQRRRREKMQRHEYELVEIDEGGVERPVKSERKPQDPRSTTGKVVDRRGRVIPEPSWTRALKRGAIFAPILAVLIFATGRNLSTAAKLLNVIVLLVIFLPTTYFMDRLLYNRFLKKQQGDRSPRK